MLGWWVGELCRRRDDRAPGPSRCAGHGGNSIATVLIANDDRFMRQLLATTLHSDAYQLLEATDGDEAWRLLQAHQPALAVLDVHLPKRNGLLLTHALRQD